MGRSPWPQEINKYGSSNCKDAPGSRPLRCEPCETLESPNVKNQTSRDFQGLGFRVYRWMVATRHLFSVYTKAGPSQADKTYREAQQAELELLTSHTGDVGELLGRSWACPQLFLSNEGPPKPQPGMPQAKPSNLIASRFGVPKPHGSPHLHLQLPLLQISQIESHLRALPRCNCQQRRA